MARLYNRIQKMDEHRLPKVMLNWDFMCNGKGWLSDLKCVAQKMNQEPPSMDHMMYDLEAMAKKALDISRLEWKEEAFTKPKLCTYVKIKDFDNPTCLAKSAMSRCQRSLVAQMLCGILPLEVETVRYQGILREHRYCRVCVTGAVEDEVHASSVLASKITERVYLISCPQLKRRKMITHV